MTEFETMAAVTIPPTTRIRKIAMNHRMRRPRRPMSSSPGMKSPSTGLFARRMSSAVVHGKLGLPERCAAFDISLGCSGYVYALSVVKAFMEAQGLRNGLLFTADPYSKILDPEDKNTVLLFGDSHAQQWLPALDLLGKRLHWKVVAWTKAACPIADVTVYNDTLGREFTECEEWRQLTAERIENLSPDKVIVSQSDAVIGDQVTDVDWADGTAQAVARLRGSGLDIEYIKDTPPLPYGQGPECVATHLDDVGACNVPVEDTDVFENRRARLYDALHQVGIPTVDTQDLICGSKVCPMVVENMLVYRDMGHITATYSRWLAPMLQFLFRQHSQPYQSLQELLQHRRIC